MKSVTSAEAVIAKLEAEGYERQATPFKIASVPFDFTAKPVVISETGATDVTGQRTRWIREMFAQLPSHPEVIGVIWFEATKEIDWRIAGSPAAAAAFAEGAADPRYDTTWSPAGHPRTT